METRRHEFYEENKAFEVNLDEHIKQALTKVENFLKKLQNQDQVSLELLINNLIGRLESSNINRRFPIEKFPLLSRYPHLTKNILNYLLNPLESHQHITEETETITSTVKAWLRSRLYLYYQMAKSLTSIMPKAEAIHFHQEYVDDETRAMRDPSKFRESLISEGFDTTFFETFASHNLIRFQENQWKAGQKILKCKWYSVMKELHDPEFAYAVACHYDFEAIKNTNPAFLLTRMKTLMQGDEYCDFCMHDTRHIKVVHPHEGFWNELQ